MVAMIMFSSSASAVPDWWHPTDCVEYSLNYPNVYVDPNENCYFLTHWQTTAYEVGTHDVIEPIVANTVVIRGTVFRSLPGPIEIVANELVMEGAGEILGYNGARGLNSGPIGLDGEPGGPVWISATLLTISSGAQIRGGSGGAGGNGVGTLVAAHGGSGGQGGSVRVIAAQSTISGTVLPGAGGDGGNSIIISESSTANVGFAVVGGAGGDGGGVFLNGVLQPNAVEVVGPASATNSGVSSPASVADCYQVTGNPGQNVLLGNGGKGGSACIILRGATGRQGDDQGAGCSTPPPRDGFTGESLFPPPATGGRGGHSLGGRGGDGGTATENIYGGQGGRGGNSHFAFLLGYCTRGGNGGQGGDAFSGKATGGRGGDSCLGTSGGNGGSAMNLAQQGAGGAGGAGNPYGSSGASGQANNGGVAAGAPGLLLVGCLWLVTGG